jgi:hypothetical protein
VQDDELVNLAAAGAWSFTTESASSPAPAPAPAAPGGGGGGGGCFIATAAFGSYDEPHVQTLRDFRDRVLLNTPLGREFVSFYYRVSPPIADFIARHETLKAAVRLGLVPVIYAVQHPSAALGMTLAIPAAIIARKLANYCESQPSS